MAKLVEGKEYNTIHGKMILKSVGISKSFCDLCGKDQKMAIYRSVTICQVAIMPNCA